MKFIKMVGLILLSIIYVACVDSKKDSDPDTPWVYLIQDESLEGWEILGGDASYSVKDGVITGTTVANTPNTFLTTNKKYDDFIFEVEYKVDSRISS